MERDIEWLWLTHSQRILPVGTPPPRTFHMETPKVYPFWFQYWLNCTDLIKALTNTSKWGSTKRVCSNDCELEAPGKASLATLHTASTNSVRQAASGRRSLRTSYQTKGSQRIYGKFKDKVQGQLTSLWHSWEKRKSHIREEIMNQDLQMRSRFI